MGYFSAWAAVEPYSRTILPGDDAETIVLDFVQPFAAGGQSIGFDWKARRDEPDLEGTLQHSADN
jgi:hypothetical protein